MNDSWLQGAVKGMNQLAERYKLNRRAEEMQAGEGAGGVFTCVGCDIGYHR